MPRQESFSAGELDPKLQARDDVDRFGAGLATCRNFIPTPAGPLERRTGSVIVCSPKSGKPRMIPFVFADAQSFVLEIGAGYIRFLHDGALIEVDDDEGGTEPYEIENTWTEDEVWRLKYSQVGDTIVFCHPSGDPVQLVRTSNTEWELEALSFEPGAAFLYGGTPRVMAPGTNIDYWAEDVAHVAKEWRWAITTILEDCNTGLRWETKPELVTEFRHVGWPRWDDVDRYCGKSSPAWAVGTTYAQNDPVLHSGSFYYSLQNSNTGHTPGATGSETWWRLATHRVSRDSVTGAYWEAQGSASFTFASSGNVFPEEDAAGSATFWAGPLYNWQGASEASHIAAKTITEALPPKLVVAPDRHVKIVWPPPLVPTAADARVLGHRVYRGQGGVYGYVGDATPNQPAPEEWSRLKDYAAGDYVSVGTTYIFLAGAVSGPNTEDGVHEPSTAGPHDEPNTLNPYWRLTDYPLRFYVDRGEAPDLTDNPPDGRNPFQRFNADGTSNYIEHPACVTHFGGRRIFANTFDSTGQQGRPAAILGSRTNDYANFQASEISVADDALDLVLASQDYQEIRSLVPMRRLVVLTSRGEWVVGGAGGAPLSALSIDALQDSTHGASWLDALRVGDAVLFASDEGWSVHDLLFSQDAQGYKSRDCSIWSRHLFEGRRLVDWAWAKTPHSVIWAVRDDGLLLSCTYLEEQGVCGWAWHDMGSGKFEGVCVVPEVVTIPAHQLPDGASNFGHVLGGASPAVSVVESAVYVLVNRGGVRTIERMASSRYTDIREGVYVDAAYGVDGRNRNTAATVTVDQADGWLEGDHVEVAPNSTALALTAWQALEPGDHIVLAPDSQDPVKLQVDSTLSLSAVVCTVLSDAVPLAYRTTPTTAWGIGVQGVRATALSGLTVDSLEDGVPHVEGVLVDDETGWAEFTEPTVVGRVGIGYLSDAELLDLAPQQARSKTKTVHRVDFEVLHSKGLEAGETFAKLTPERATPVSVNGYQGDTGLVQVRVANTWNKGGRACVRQRNPLPLTLIAATRQVDVGED